MIPYYIDNNKQRFSASDFLVIRDTHQSEQMEDQIAVFSNDVKRLTTQIDEVVELGGGFVATVYNIGHVRCKYERCSIPEK